MAYPFARPQAALLLQTDSSDPPGLPPVGAPLSSAPPADLPPPPTTALDAVTALQLGDPSTWALPPMTPVPSHVPTPRVEPEEPDPYAQMRFSLEQPRGAGGSPRPPVNTPTIGAARIGDRYEPKSWGQIMTSDTPLQDILEHVLGPKRPPSVYSADPMGAQAALINAGPPPMFGAPIEPVGDMTTWLAALVKRNPELAGLAKAAGDTHPSRLFDHVDSVQTFEHLAREGKLQQATGKFTKAEEAAQTPVSAGELAGYSPADIAHFYVARRGGRADYAAYELVKNLHAEGRPVNAALWDQVVTEPPKGYRLEGKLYVPEGPPKGLYSRVDAFVETLPNTALHPSKWKALLQSNASAEELEWRGVLDYLTQQGQTKLTPADLRAYLVAHPPPKPALTVLRSPEPKPVPAPGQGVTDLDLYMQQEHQGHRPTTPAQWDELAEALQNRADETEHPAEVTRLLDLADDATGRGEGAQAPPRPIAPLLAEFLSDRRVGGNPAPVPTTPTEWERVYDELLHLSNEASEAGDDMLAIRYEAQADLAAGHLNAARAGAPTEAAPWLDAWLQQRHGPAPTTAMAWSDVADELDDFGRRAEANGDTEAAHRYDLMAGEAEARGATAPGAVNQFIGTPVDTARPRYGQYTLPGGDRYRENLTILAPRTHPSRQPRGGEWSHFNVTVRDHGGGIRWRSTDALTAADVQRLRDQYETPTAPTARWTVEATPAPAPPDPTVDFRSGHWDSQPNILVHTRSNERELPGWGRGHFIEEVQSDWHQRGAKSGYRTQLPPEQERRLAQIDDEMREWTIKLSTANQESHAAILTTSHRGDHVYLDARSRANEASDALNALRREQHDIRGGHEQVPDAPFKESWPDLALKQHLLEAADDPAAQWVAFTSGSTQAARYDLRKEINRLVFEPEERGDYGFGTLIAYDHNGDIVLQEGGLEPKDLDEFIGREPADKLREQIEVHAKRTRAQEADQWSAEENPRSNGIWNVVDQNGNDLRDRNGRIRNFRYEDEARDVADEKNRIDWEGALPKIEGMDLEVGGEGMTYFYDKLLPARLDKILKKFGAKVERTTIRVPLEKAGRNTGKALGLAVFDSAPPSSLIDGKLPVGPNRKLYSRELLGEAFRIGELNLFHLPEPLRRAVEARGIDEPIWIVRLSPEVKARLRKEGLPLMAGAPVGALALQARQDDRRPAGPPLAVSHAPTPPPAPSASPAALATLAQRFPRFAAALATHPPPAAQPPLEALRKATSIGADPRRAEARAVMEPAYRPAANPRPPVIRAPSTSEWLTDLEQRFYRMLSQTLPGQASDATGVLTNFAGKAEDLSAGPPVVTTSTLPPPGDRAAVAAFEELAAGVGQKRFAGAALPGAKVGTLAASVEYRPPVEGEGLLVPPSSGRVWVPEGDKWAGTGLYKVKPEVMPRLDTLTRMGVTEGVNWAGALDELHHAFGGNEQEMVRWARSWGAMSPATNALDSTRESVGVLLWQLEHPGEVLTKEVAGKLEGGFTMKNRGSKIPNYLRARADQALSGDKAEAMSGYMAGQDRRPLDVHAIYGITGNEDPNLSFTAETKALRELMTKAEGLKARNPGGLTDRQLYLRYEDALRRGLAEIDPRANGNAIFGDFWEGVRLHKGLPKQGGPIDMLRKQGLLGFGAMLNPVELRRALLQAGWTKLAVAGLMAAIGAEVVARNASAEAKDGAAQ